LNKLEKQPVVGRFSLPPMIDVTPTYKRVQRYFSAAGTSTQAITPTNVLTSLGCIGTVVNSTVAAFHSSFRLHRIVIWGGLQASGAESVSVSWSSALSSSVRDTEKVIAYPEGGGIPGAMTFTPPKGSIAEFWQGANTNAFVRISLSPGSIMDVHLSVTLGNTLTPPSATVATAAVGTLYYLPLDGPSTHLITPLGLPTTF
jgi:hypothetical protein